LFYAYQNFWRVVPVLVVPEHANTHLKGEGQQMGKHRRQFYLEAAEELQFELLKNGVDLILLRGNDQLVPKLKEICEVHHINYVVTSYPRGTYEDDLLGELCQFTSVFTCEDDSLIQKDDLPFSVEPLPNVFTEFRKRLESRLVVRDICDYPDFSSYENKHGFGDSIDFEQIAERHPNTAYPFRGGEMQAMKRLNYYLWESEAITTYKKTRNGMIGKDYSSKLSAYLALGNISPVQVYHAVKDFEEKIEKNKSTYWLFFELLWREYFQLVADTHKTKIYSEGGIRAKEIKFENDLNKFQQWCKGQTDHPFINANMKELVETGYMSNRGRQNVASYLVHNLKVDWRWGASFFEKHLIDYDVSVNWCNWMYVAGVGNDPRSRVFNPDKQQKRYDPQGQYCSIWNPS